VTRDVTWCAAGLRCSYEETGTIAFSDPMLTAVQQLVRASAMSNFQSVPTDCPQRERRGWLGEWAFSLGDANVFPF
jgi:alpha-L-rhamnosidase